VPGIINVGATGIRPNPRYEPGVSYDVRAFFSNYGSKVDISAPGGDCGEADNCTGVLPNWFEYLILSSIVAPNPACAATQSCPVGYGWKGGTSMAAPHVAGVAGLVHDTNSNLNPRQVTALLKRTADNVGSRLVFGHGVVNADAATR
jgi:lantibiotic leader peptide-processing serine protease